jgi:hypothetical protein
MNQPLSTTGNPFSADAVLARAPEGLADSVAALLDRVPTRAEVAAFAHVIEGCRGEHLLDQLRRLRDRLCSAAYREAILRFNRNPGCNAWIPNGWGRRCGDRDTTGCYHLCAECAEFETSHAVPPLVESVGDAP